MAITELVKQSETFSVNDQRLVGQSLSRNQRLFTSEIQTVVPFGFTFKPNSYQQYSLWRDILSDLRTRDRSMEDYLNMVNSGWVNIVLYRGDLNAGQIDDLVATAASLGKTLVISGLPTVAPTTIIVKPGDFIQIGRYPYIATETVFRGSGGNVMVPVHRALLNTITTSRQVVIGQYGTTEALGGNSYTGITFCTLLREYPQFNHVPMANESFISWGGNFTALEAVLVGA